MIKNVKKGTKVPYNGYLLGLKEYEEYKAFMKSIPLIEGIIKENKDDENRTRIRKIQ